MTDSIYPQYIRPREGRSYDEVVLPAFLCEIRPGIAKSAVCEKAYRFESFGTREEMVRYTNERVKVECLVVHHDGRRVPAKRVVSKGDKPGYITQDLDHRIYKGPI